MQEWIVIAVIAVAVIFGASKLPQFARNVGKAQGEFKKGLKEGATDDEMQQAAAPPSEPAPAPQPPATQPPAPQAPAVPPTSPEQPPTQT